MKGFNILIAVSVLLLSGCMGGRYMSADADLEAIYSGMSYYDVVNEFGHPDATASDGNGGTRVAYNSVNLNGTRAAELYRRYNMRNRATKVTGAPNGGITFSFDDEMKCYAVDSDFQHERTKEARPEKPTKPGDPRKPNPVKPKIPRTVEYPYYEECSPYAELVSIEKVEVERDKIKFYFQYRQRTPEHRPLNDAGIYIMPEVYVEDVATGKRYALREADGIALYPERSQFAHNRGGYDVLVYSLTFKPVALGTEFVNIVEPGHSGFNFYGVDIRTPMTTKEELRNQQ